MKKIVYTLTLLIIFSSCQEKQVAKQYFEDCTEIDMAKTVMDSYLKQDWVKLKSVYSDTARIWQNKWFSSDPGMTVDEVIEGDKAFVSMLDEYRYDETIWEMIIQDSGIKWVHFWGNSIGRFQGDSVELEVPAHIAFGIVEDKIVYEAGFWDNLPGYLLQLARSENED